MSNLHTPEPNLWLYVGENTRLAIAISDEDRAAFNALPRGKSIKKITARDSVGNLWELRRDSCGLGCYCSASGAVLEPASSMNTVQATPEGVTA